VSGVHHPRPGAGGLTVHARLGPGAVLRHGSLQPYRRVAAAEGEAHRVRADLLGPEGGRRFALTAGSLRPLLTLAHVTDLQLPDVGSTARFEFFNREVDDPLFRKLVPVQRPQEALTARAMQAMVSTLNSLHERSGAPVSGGGLDLVVTTGDAIDNAQWNEVRNWLALMDGGRVRPGSGGAVPASVQARDWPDEAFWRPDGGADVWRERFGFGDRPRLLEQALAAFDASGLLVPWLACYGNHEALLQGVGVVTPELAALMVGDRKPSRLRPSVRREEALDVFTTRAHEFFGAGDAQLAVVPDLARRPVGRREFVDMHFSAGARPAGHGFTDRNRTEGTAYYAHDTGGVRFVALDTNDLAGGADGCLDEVQVAWLRATLEEVSSRFTAEDGSTVTTGREDRLVVVFSHHGSTTLTGTHGAPQLLSLLHRFPNVVLWLNGHTHTNAVRAHARPGAPGDGLWEVTTCAVMDWPCQARVVELLDAGDGFLAVACTMLDHEGRVVPAEDPELSPADLAGLHRELAGNVPWSGFDSPTSGTPTDRNVVLGLRAPFALA